MGLLGNLVDGLKVKNNDEDEEYYLDDDYYDEEEDYYDNDEEEDAPAKSSILSRFTSGKKSVADDEPQPKRGGLFGGSKVVQMQNTNMEVTMKRPKDLNDAKEICNHLISGKAVVINLEGVDGGIAQRIIDFTVGAIYSMEGDLQQISKFIFIASPHSIELSGDFTGDFSRAYTRSESAPKTSGGTYSFNGNN